MRTMKEKNNAVFNEDEKINTLSIDGELLLVVLSSVAQQEVENISNNVKKGLAMKMSSGEIVGFVGALGYDYDPVTKTMTVNQEGAKIVQYIFNKKEQKQMIEYFKILEILILLVLKHGIRQQLQALFAMKNMLGICCKVRHLR